MSGYVKAALGLFAAAVLSWYVLIVVNPSGLEFVLAIAAVAFSAAFLCFLAICLTRRLGKSISPYRVFAIADGLIALCVCVYAAYDIMTDTGWFAGLLGTLLLIFALPVLLLLLLADYLVWRIRKGRNKRI